MLNRINRKIIDYQIKNEHLIIEVTFHSTKAKTNLLTMFWWGLKFKR
jgi:hypothetical protein